MTTSDSQAPLVPSGSQPLIALFVAIGLVAVGAWFVVAGGLTGGLVAYDAAPVIPAGYTVNINTASVPELSQLPGLGPAMAQRIADHRRTHGPFASHEDLLAVAGIGPVTLEGLRPHLRSIRSIRPSRSRQESP